MIIPNLCKKDQRWLKGFDATTKMRILTNLRTFPEPWHSSGGIIAKPRTATSVWDFVVHAPEYDVFLIDCEPLLTLELCALSILFWFRRKPIIAVDLILRRPTTWESKLARIFKMLLFLRVDHFVHYFRQLDSYQKYYRIGPDRSSYVPFKSNLKGRFTCTADCHGEYVLCFGQSERDFDTFIKAMATLPFPAAIPRPNFDLLKEHGSKFTTSLNELPANIRLLDDDGSLKASIRIIGDANLVALPILPNRISASGIGIAFMAMSLGKCVILTEGPGAMDVFTDRAFYVPAGDPARLAEMIERVWSNRDLQEQVAMSGYEFAESCGTENDLRRRVLDVLVNRYRAR
jgi:glycosyltransferase involved in cell wall biosynthesis